MKDEANKNSFYKSIQTLNATAASSSNKTIYQYDLSTVVGKEYVLNGAK